MSPCQHISLFHLNDWIRLHLYRCALFYFTFLLVMDFYIHFLILPTPLKGGYPVFVAFCLLGDICSGKFQERRKDERCTQFKFCEKSTGCSPA